jgi:hypothetical protein
MISVAAVARFGWLAKGRLWVLDAPVVGARQWRCPGCLSPFSADPQVAVGGLQRRCMSAGRW